MSADKKQLEVLLSPDGNIKVETHNIKGGKCMKYMELFSELINARVVDSEFTKDYYEREEEAVESAVNEVTV